MYYDHFLAKNWDTYHAVPLEQYSQDFYEDLQVNFSLLPARVQKFLPIMIDDNWLLKYRTIEGLDYILYQMDRRTKGISKMSLAGTELLEHYEIFETQFTSFFNELQSHLVEFKETDRYLLIE